MEAPAPLSEGLKAIQNLGDGEYIEYLHRFQPCKFIPILKERDFGMIEFDNTPDYRLYIYNKSNTDLEKFIKDNHSV